jgi:hypothetical protein
VNSALAPHGSLEERDILLFGVCTFAQKGRGARRVIQECLTWHIVRPSLNPLIAAVYRSFGWPDVVRSAQQALPERKNGMIGAIRKRDILAHPFVTVQCFGWQVFLRTLLAGRDQTFLSLLTDANVLQPHEVKVPELIGHCINLERKAESIYERLAGWFAGHPSVKAFFDDLARQEKSHAELLELCRISARREDWLEAHFGPWRDSVRELERQIDDIESSLESTNDMADALRLVIQIEGSEVNELFRGVVMATDSPFVKRVSAFQRAGERHISYICEEIPKFEPVLTADCQNLKEHFFADTASPKQAPQ